MAFDLTIVGGTLVDGTGVPGAPRDVGVRDGRVAAVGRLDQAESARRIDARGKIVAPGFVDAHSHSDLSLLSDPRGLSKVHQGVTTEIVGNCGLGVAPLLGIADMPVVRDAIYLIDPDPGVAWTWRSMAEYLAVLEAAQPAVNVAALAGHLAIHASVVGYADRAATIEEQSAMAALLDGALADGAIGLSTGLMYAPIAYARVDELIALGRVVAEYGRVFAMHMRNYASHLLDAVDEAIEVGRTSACRVQVSHLAVGGRRNWGSVRQALDHLDRARQDGVRVRQDIYPYIAGSANLSQLLPGWVHEGGTARMVQRLHVPAERERVRREWAEVLVHRWDEILVCWVRPGDDASAVGRTIADVAAERGAEPDATALDLIAEHDGLVNMIAFGRSEEDLRSVLAHPETLVGSDGLAVDPTGASGSGHPHPRYYGCYPRLLGMYARDEAVLTLEAAIYKSSGLVAETFGLADRGVVAEGRAADLVVFDRATVIDRATFLNPQQFPLGIETVVVNGQLVIDNGTHTGARPGKVLRRT